jgi:anti-sigma B factor antagonist
VDVLVAEHRASGATVVTPVGQLDMDTAPRLHAALHQLRVRSVNRIVVDLRKVTYCDSTGLSALALARNYCAEAGGYLRLAVLSPLVLQLLAAVGIGRTVPIYRGVGAACAGDLDGLIAVPCGQSPWGAPGPSSAFNRPCGTVREKREAAVPGGAGRARRRPAVPAGTGLPATV